MLNVTTQSKRLESLLAEAEILRTELGRRRRGPAWKYIPQDPTERQYALLQSKQREVLYGGAAGGGKSSALLMGALQYVLEPGYAALILRRSYTDLALPGAIMDRADSWLRGTDASWSAKDRSWSFPSGATLQFGYLNEDGDKHRYQSAEFQFIAFDELTQFPESWYVYMFSRLRRAKAADVPIRMWSASNPGGIGHDWVYKRFFEETKGTRAFIPARLTDNPHVDQAEYASALSELDLTTRRQLLDGVWVRDSGGNVYAYNPPDHLIDNEAVQCDHHVLGIDYGFSEATAFCVLGWRANSTTVYVLESIQIQGLTPSAAAERVRDLNKVYNFEKIVGDSGGLGKGYIEEARQRFYLPIEPAQKANKNAYIALCNDDFKANRLRIVREANLGLEKQLTELAWNKERTKQQDGSDDHLCDAFLYGWRACRAAWEMPASSGPAEGTPEWEEARMEAALLKQHKASMDPLSAYEDQLEWWE